MAGVGVGIGLTRKKIISELIASLQAPISSEISVNTQQAYGFDQLVSGYIGDTVRLQRVSDNVEADFGTVNSSFNWSNVNNWLAGSNAKVVKFYCQKGCGKELLAVGDIYLTSLGTPYRFGTDYSYTDGQLTLNNKGGIACKIENGAYFQLATSGLVGTNGLEFHTLTASLQRKKAANDLTDPIVGSNAVGECYLSYGLGTTNNIKLEIAGGNYTHVVRAIHTGASGTDQTITTSSNRVKQNSLFVSSVVANSEEISLYGYAKRILNATPSAGNITAISNLANGTLRIGRRYAGSSGESTTFANVLFGGIIITSTLLPLQRFLLQCKLAGIANQHLLRNKKDVEKLFDEIIYFKDTDISNSRVIGKNNKLTLNINTSTSYNGDTPNWDLQNVNNITGINGIYTPDDTNEANVFEATNNYFAATTTGTVVAVGYRDNTGNNAQYANNLGAWFAQGNGSQFLTAPAPPLNASLEFGWDHQAPKMANYMATDPNNIVGTRQFPDDFAYDLANQPMGKYNMNTANTAMVYGETINGSVWNEAEWLNNVNVSKVVPNNITYPFNKDQLQLQIGTFQAPNGYSRTLTQVEKDALALQATNSNLVTGAGVVPFGHLDGGIAKTDGWGAVTDSVDDAKIMTSARLTQMKGLRSMFGFAKRVLTQKEIEIINANLYKLIEPNDLILNTISGASLALSLKRLNKFYSGACIRVRKLVSGVSSETNIGFINNTLDAASLLSFASNADNGNIYVPKWYDQSELSNHVVQTTAGNQPQIVAGGALNIVDGNLSLYFDQSRNCHMSTTNSYAHFPNKRGAFVAKYKNISISTDKNYIYGTFYHASTKFIVRSMPQGSFNKFYDGSNWHSLSANDAKVFMIETINRTGNTALSVIQNSNTVGNFTIPNSQPSNYKLYIGSATDGYNNANMHMSDFIEFNRDLTSSEITQLNGAL